MMPNLPQRRMMDVKQQDLQLHHTSSMGCANMHPTYKPINNHGPPKHRSNTALTQTALARWTKQVISYKVTLPVLWTRLTFPGWRFPLWHPAWSECSPAVEPVCRWPGASGADPSNTSSPDTDQTLAVAAPRSEPSASPATPVGCRWFCSARSGTPPPCWGSPRGSPCRCRRSARPWASQPLRHCLRSAAECWSCAAEALRCATRTNPPWMRNPFNPSMGRREVIAWYPTHACLKQLRAQRTQDHRDLFGNIPESFCWTCFSMTNPKVHPLHPYNRYLTPVKPRPHFSFQFVNSILLNAFIPAQDWM